MAQAIRRALQPQAETTVITDTLIHSLAQERGSTPDAFRTARNIVADRYGLTDTDRRVVIVESWHVTALVFDHWDDLRNGTVPPIDVLVPVLPDFTYPLGTDTTTLISRHQARLRQWPDCRLGQSLRVQAHRYPQVARLLHIPRITSDQAGLDEILHNLSSSRQDATTSG